VLTIDNEEAITSLNVNNRLLFRHDLNEMVFYYLEIRFGAQFPVRRWFLVNSPTSVLGIYVPLSRKSS